MESIFNVLEAICIRLDSIEVNSLARFRVLNAKWARCQCQVSHGKSGLTKRKSDCNSVVQSKSPSTFTTVIQHNTTSESIAKPSGKQQVYENSLLNQQCVTSKTNDDKGQSSKISTSYRKSMPNEGSKIQTILIGETNVAVGFGKISNTIVRVLINSNYPDSMISKRFLSKLGTRMNKRRRRAAPFEGGYEINGEILPVVCRISLPINLNGITRFHNMIVINGMQLDCIIGQDFIEKHEITFDPQLKTILFKQIHLHNHQKKTTT